MTPHTAQKLPRMFKIFRFFAKTANPMNNLKIDFPELTTVYVNGDTMPINNHFEECEHELKNP